jgi:hypothetical protein
MGWCPSPPPRQVSEALAPRVHDSFILKEVDGSDHVPLGLVIRAPAAGPTVPA